MGKTLEVTEHTKSKHFLSANVRSEVQWLRARGRFPFPSIHSCYAKAEIERNRKTKTKRPSLSISGHSTPKRSI